MINGLGVLGWGVGGIEAEAAMLGQPVSMLIPEVVGFKLTGQLREGATATDLVLTVTQMLRKKGVVGKFVEFYGAGLAGLPLADRATIANMAPEYGATCGIFPVDAETLRYLRFTGRPEPLVQLVEAYTKEQGLFHTPQTPEAMYSDTLELDLGTVEPSLAGPKRPQDRVALGQVKKSFAHELPGLLSKASRAARPARHGGSSVKVTLGSETHELQHGSVVIAAITSCTNTSNPSVMLAAGLLAKKAVEKGLQTQTVGQDQPGTGSKVVTDYLIEAGLMRYLEQSAVSSGRLRLHRLASATAARCRRRCRKASTRAVSSSPPCCRGNRNFEGRDSPRSACQLSRLAAAGRRLRPGRPHGHRPAQRAARHRTPTAQPVFLKDIWPSRMEVEDAIRSAVHSEMFHKEYGEVFQGDEQLARHADAGGRSVRLGWRTPPTSSIRRTSRT